MRVTTAILTPGEDEVLETLNRAWDQFAKLPIYFPDGKDAFKAAIKAAQFIVLARPAQAALNPELEYNDRKFVEA